MVFWWDLCEFICVDLVVRERGGELKVVEGTLVFVKPLW